MFFGNLEGTQKYAFSFLANFSEWTILILAFLFSALSKTFFWLLKIHLRESSACKRLVIV